MSENSIVRRLNEILEIKNNLKNSLINTLSLDINDDTLFKEYSEKIDELEIAPYTNEETPVVAGTFGKKENTLETGNTMYYNGDFKAYRVMNAVWNDYAEFFEAEGLWDYGDIIEFNPETNRFRRAQSEDSNLVVGVASNTFGSIVGGKPTTIEENLNAFIPVGLMGRVNVKIKGKINVGDLISSSDEPGIGKKSEGKVGTVVGKALASSDLEYNVIPMLIVRG